MMHTGIKCNNKEEFDVMVKYLQVCDRAERTLAFKLAEGLEIKIECDDGFTMTNLLDFLNCLRRCEKLY